MISSAFELEILEVEYVDKCRIWYNNFELIYILEGKGTHMINGKDFNYDPKNFFVFVPGDCNSFIPEEKTIYCSIRFTELFFRANNNNQVDQREWYRQLEQIFFNFNRMPGCILKDESDRVVVRTLLEAIIKEHQKEDPNKMQIIRKLLFSVLALAARNISILCMQEICVKKNDQRLVSLLHFIQNNIYEREKLTLEYLANEFNMSKNYLSEYFKKRTGQNIKRYIQLYRLRLIRARLNFSDKSISEIAWEFNFTDLSHFNKVFKKEFKVSPSKFREGRKPMNIVV